MIKSDIDGVILTTQKIISVDGGNVLHAMKRDDPGYTSFGEAYFSTVKSQAIKAWKRHRRMTLNIVVPVGSIRFIIVDDRNIKAAEPHYQEVILSKDNYNRLSVPSMVWVGFQGLSKGNSMLLNIASIAHEPDEFDRRDINEIEFDWSLKK
jgi:dTDP-4-dehydrorhamnose 3,5-epimerase